MLHKQVSTSTDSLKQNAIKILLKRPYICICPVLPVLLFYIEKLKGRDGHNGNSIYNGILEKY